MQLPDKVRIFEVGPRDGLQNEKQQVPTEIKQSLVHRLMAAGLTAIEVGAFVSPKWVPQMADTADLFAGLKAAAGTTFSALVPNMRGLEAARQAGVREIAVFTAASETFSQKNINCSVKESLQRFQPVLEAAHDSGMKVRGYISTVLGCPYEGRVAPEAVAEVAQRLDEMGCYEISLGDTIGVGTPRKAARLIDLVAERVPVNRIALHFHDTWGQALANILACLQKGVRVIDAAIAGLGGCPYAPGASGNVATEDVVYMLNGLGIETGVDLQALAEAGWFISDHLKRPPSSRVSQAMRSSR